MLWGTTADACRHGGRRPPPCSWHVPRSGGDASLAPSDRRVPAAGTAKASFGQAAAAEATLDRPLILHLGALPLLWPILDRLRLREIVNRHGHPDGSMPGDLNVGLVAGVLVLNR